MPAVVADSSPLVYLARLGHFEVLRVLHQEVFIPPAVWREVGVQGQDFAEGRCLSRACAEGWVRVLASANAAVPEDEEFADLDVGEREAILLALDLRALLVIDERDGRAVATRLGLRLTGTLGLLGKRSTARSFPA